MAGDSTTLASEETLFDAAMLDTLRAALGPATDGLVQKATAVLEDRLARLEAESTEPNTDSCARLAHEIGGVAGQIGLRRLSLDALALEQLCRGDDAASARVAAGRIGALGRASIEAVRAR